MGFCNKISPVCDVCFEVLYGKCNDVLTLSLGLPTNTTFFLNLIDKFDIVTPLTITTDGSGDFTITQTWTEFFGDIEVQIFSDTGRTELVDFLQNSNAYNCVILTQELSGQNNLVPPSVFENEFSFLFDGVDEFFNIDAVRASLATTTVGTWLIWFKPVDATPVGTEVIISFGDTNADSHIEIRMLTSGALSAFHRSGGVSNWSIDTDNPVFFDNVYTHIAITVDGISDAKIYINKVFVPQTKSGSGTGLEWFNDIPGLDNGRFACRNRNNAGNTNFCNCNQDEAIFVNRALTASQVASVFNLGVPKDESSILNGVSYFRMGEKALWDGTNWTMLDQIGSNDSTSVNMEFTDRVTDTPS